MHYKIIEHLLWLVTFVTVITLFRYYLPAKTSLEPDRQNYAELKARYQFWYFLYLLPFFFFTATGSYTLQRLIGGYAGHYLRKQGDNLFVLSPSPYFWALPALFIGLVWAAFLSYTLFKILLGDRYAEFIRYSDLKCGYDTLRGATIVCVVTLLIAALAIELGRDTYTRFTKTEIIVNPFFSMQERHLPYSMVMGIYAVSKFRAPNGAVRTSPHYLIAFTDGSSWSTRDNLHDPEPATDERVLQFVAEQSGKSIRQVEIYPPAP